MTDTPADNPTTEPVPKRTDDDRKIELAMHLAAIVRITGEIEGSGGDQDAQGDPFAHIGGSAPLGPTHTARNDPVVMQAIESFKTQTIEQNFFAVAFGIAEMVGEHYGIAIGV